jgi:hypothetical protein
MAIFGKLLRHVGAIVLLGIIGLCQSVAAHDDGRARRDDRRVMVQRVVHRYELVRVQRVSPDLNEYTYRAWLTSLGAPLPDGATAVVRSVVPGTVVVDGTLTFGPVGAGRSVVSRDTFSVRHHRRRPYLWLWPNLRWTVTPATSTGGDNHAPTANAGADRAATLGAVVTLDASGSTDPDGDSLRYTWTLLRPSGSTAALSSPTSATPSFRPDRRGTFEARLVVDDGTLSSASDSVVISVGNSAPSADAGPDQTARVTQTVTLDGSASSDPDGDAVSFQWMLVARPASSSAALSDAAAEAPSFLVDRPGTYTAQLVVVDGASSSAADTVTVRTINTAPIAQAGADRTVAVGATATLNGAGSSDADGDVLAYQWTLLSRPAGSAAALSSVSDVAPSLVVDRPGSYVVRLVVNDGQASSVADTVLVSTVNSAPVASAGPDQTAPVGQTITLNGGGSSDVDGDALTFTWTLATRPAGSSAALSSTSAVQPTFVIDRAGLYQVRLSVSDGAVSSAADVVDVQTENSAPVANAGSDQAAVVGQTVTLDGSGSTDVDGNALTYVWALTTRPAGSGAVLSDPATVMPVFRVDRAGTYVAQLIVNDGTVSSVADTVTVATRNTPPRANAGPDLSVIAGRQVLLAGDGSSDADGDVLAYSWALLQRPAGSGAVLARADTVSPMLRADRPGTYVVQLIVNDGAVDSAPDTLTITTGNTAPVASAGVDQRGLSVGGLAVLDGSGSVDADGHPLTYRWSLLSVPPGSAATLSDPTAMSPSLALDAAGQFVAQVIVNDGFQDSVPDTVVLETSNRAPVADAGSDQSVFIGALVGVTGAASSDPDADVLVYQWQFAAVPAGSAATLTNAASVAPTFTADVAGTYRLSLTVTDPAGATSSDVVLVSAFTPATVSVSAADASASESGPDAGSVTFTRTGSTAAPLVVSYTVGGSATRGADYAALLGSVTIPAGRASVTLAVQPVDDAIFEGAETVVVGVAASAGYLVGAPGSSTITISDNDPQTVTIVATDAAASETGLDPGTFTITRLGPTTANLRVSYSVEGSATQGVDYVGLGSQVVILAGQSSVTLTVTPLADAVSEGPEDVEVELVPTSSASPGSPDSARVVITSAN